MPTHASTIPRNPRDPSPADSARAAPARTGGGGAPHLGPHHGSYPTRFPLRISKDLHTSPATAERPSTRRISTGRGSSEPKWGEWGRLLLESALRPAPDRRPPFPLVRTHGTSGILPAAFPTRCSGRVITPPRRCGSPSQTSPPPPINRICLRISHEQG